MAQSPFVGQAAWPNTAAKHLTVLPASDQYQVVTSLNNMIAAMQAVLVYLSGGSVAMTTATLSAGTTVTLAVTASVVSIVGVIGAALAAETAKAFGALGTIPANTWGLIVVERVAAGTTSFVSAALNYTTGYTSEAAAIAAMPAQSASKAVVGYLTILASSSTWIAGTDALAGNTGGNPATTTNYYSTPGAADMLSWANVKQITKGGSPVLL